MTEKDIADLQALIDQMPADQREKFQALLSVSEARKDALYSVMNSLGDFAFADRAIDGADFIDAMGMSLQELQENNDIGMNTEPMVIKNSTGEYLHALPDVWTDDLSEAVAIFGNPGTVGLVLEPGEDMLPLVIAQADQEPNEIESTGA